MKNISIIQTITDRQDASLKIFFKEVSKIPLADINEEIRLAKRIRKGDIQAANRLVEANLRFVITVAKQYQNKGIPLVDLIQIGAIGCREAAMRWDGEKGYKFISYAVWWIRQAIVHAISYQCRTVRLPTSQIVSGNKINKYIEDFEKENQRIPSLEEISDNTKLPIDKINSILTSRTVSLDSPFKDEDANTLLDILPNENIKATDEHIEHSETSDELEYVLSQLSNRESDVLRMSFGLGMNPMQNEEIGSRLGLGEERVRQVQKEAIEKIQDKYSDILRELL